MFNKIKKWLFSTGYDVGERVYWNNDAVDSYFTGEYVVVAKRNKKGYIRIHNDKVGHRVVPYWYLEPAEED